MPPERGAYPADAKAPCCCGGGFRAGPFGAAGALDGAVRSATDIDGACGAGCGGFCTAAGGFCAGGAGAFCAALSGEELLHAVNAPASATDKMAAHFFDDMNEDLIIALSLPPCRMMVV